MSKFQMRNNRHCLAIMDAVRADWDLISITDIERHKQALENAANYLASKLEEIKIMRASGVGFRKSMVD